VTDDPVCVELLDALALLMLIDATDVASCSDPATLAAIATQADAVIGAAHRLRIHALADLGATMRAQR
jgi:hypothetical protein